MHCTCLVNKTQGQIAPVLRNSEFIQSAINSKFYYYLHTSYYSLFHFNIRTISVCLCKWNRHWIRMSHANALRSILVDSMCKNSLILIRIKNSNCVDQVLLTSPMLLFEFRYSSSVSLVRSKRWFFFPVTLLFEFSFLYILHSTYLTTYIEI